MATSDPSTASREALTAALRPALDAGPDGGSNAAGRLACLLAARARFTAIVGAAPGGDLEALPAPFEGFDVPADARAALTDLPASPDGPAALGERYERTLAGTDRDRHGQFYTPRPVADALVRWALDARSAHDSPARVLDPAVGTGTFLLAAFRHLEIRHPDRRPAALLARLVGVDLDGVALQLAGLRLGAAAGVPAPGSLALHHGSFFDYDPAGGDGVGASATLDPVDAVVGNPPFVRAEALAPDAEHYRRHLAAFGPPDATPWLDGEDALSRRADAYVYFVTHATRFLRPGGRLALVLPTKWLMSAYGEDLRRFLRERYRVSAVVGFRGRAFDDALVDTCLLFAERTPDAGASRPLRFARLAEPVGADRLLAVPNASVDPAAGTAPVVERTQRSLTASGSLARYLDVPPALLSMLDGPPFVRLDTLADVARGTMTGANRFFLVDEATAHRFGIATRFLQPAVKSLRSVDRPLVEAADVDRWLVDVHPFVAEVRAKEDDADVEAAVTDALAAAGHDGLLRYIAHAERAGWHEGRTCQSRPVWFDLGPLRAPAAFVPKLLRERVFAVRNAAGAVPSNAIDGVWPAEGVEAAALLAVLNASVGRAAMEVTGRDEAGMLQLMTYETASLPTPDVRQLARPAAAALARAGERYARDPGPETLARLDRVVDDGFDLPLAPDRLREHAAALRRQRVDGAEPVAMD